MVRPILEYAGTVWDPTSQAILTCRRRCSARQLDLSAVSGIMSTLGRRSLLERRFISTLGMFCQAHHRQMACTIPPYITMTQPRTRTSRDLQFLPPQVYLDTYKFSFFPTCGKALNIPPSSIVSASSVNAFKSCLRRSFTCGEIYMPPPPLYNPLFCELYFVYMFLEVWFYPTQTGFMCRTSGK